MCEPECPVPYLHPGLCVPHPLPRRVSCAPHPHPVLNPGQPRKHLLPAPWQPCHALPPPWAPTVSCSSVGLSETPAWPRTKRILLLWPHARGFLSCAQEPSREAPRPAVIAQPAPYSQLPKCFPLVGAFPGRRTRTLLHLPSDFVGVLHPAVWNVPRGFTCGIHPIPSLVSARLFFPPLHSVQIGWLTLPFCALHVMMLPRRAPSLSPLTGVRRGPGMPCTCRGKRILLWL